MSMAVKIIRGEVIPLKRDTDKAYDEYKVEKTGGSRFAFKVQTHVNDRVEKSPRLFLRCSFYVGNAEEAEKVRNKITLGAVLDVDGNNNRRSFKDKEGNTVWIDEVDVKDITVIQPSVQQQTAEAGNAVVDDDLPF